MILKSVQELRDEMESFEFGYSLREERNRALAFIDRFKKTQGELLTRPDNEFIHVLESSRGNLLLCKVCAPTADLIYVDIFNKRTGLFTVSLLGYNDITQLRLIYTDDKVERLEKEYKYFSYAHLIRESERNSYYAL